MSAEFNLVERSRRALAENGFAPDFPPEALSELAAARNTPIAIVKDLTDRWWSSIDNEDSRDLDQVEYAEPAANGCIRLYLGIADVATRVPRDSAIDRRAAQNTVSIYAPGKTFHLLPEELSTGLTSLNEGAERLAVVVEMLIDADGEVHDAQVSHARVRNHAKLSYEAVADWIDSRTTVPMLENRAIQEQLTLQLEASRRLITLRKKMGALTFSSYEARPVTRNGQVVDLALVSHNRARDLIESFMIAANVATATFLKTRGEPIIERIVRAPERWERIRQIAAEQGFELPEEPSPRPLAEFLARRKSVDPRGFRDLSLSIVKLLGPGEYVVEYPNGPQTSHFGLALDDYSHSTAPNRRFADLVLQRLLLAALRGNARPYRDSELSQIAVHCTEREHAAKKVERLLRKVAAAYILRDRVGQEFSAIVTGASSKGTYVRVQAPPVEGRVLRGERGMDVGDPVRVRLIAIDPECGFIDFARA